MVLCVLKGTPRCAPARSTSSCAGQPRPASDFALARTDTLPSLACAVIRAPRRLYFGDNSVLVDDYSLQCYQTTHNWLQAAAVLVLVVRDARSHVVCVTRAPTCVDGPRVSLRSCLAWACP